MNRTRIFGLTSLAMIAFASNSLVCRAALKQTGIDAATFTFVRIIAGAIALWLIMQVRDASAVAADGDRRTKRGSWLSAAALFVYAAAFSFAYNTLSAGMGALLLFGAVQATMILWGLGKGEKLRAIQIVGLVVAVSGLVLLVFPGLFAPSFTGSILMLGAGVAWGIYSLRGKGEKNPVSATAGNFLRALPFAVAVSIVMLPWTRLDLVQRIARLESRRCGHRSTQRASPRRHGRDPPARRTDYVPLPRRLDRRVRWHRARRNRKTACDKRVEARCVSSHAILPAELRL